MKTVSFRAMKDGTREDYLLLDQSERDFALTLPLRVLEALRWVSKSTPRAAEPKMRDMQIDVVLTTVLVFSVALATVAGFAAARVLMRAADTGSPRSDRK